jgi:hypothetical protein
MFVYQPSIFPSFPSEVNTSITISSNTKATQERSQQVNQTMTPQSSSFSLTFLALLLLSQHIHYAAALYFRLTSLTATLTTIPTSSCPPTDQTYYNVSFRASNPNAVWEQGGNGEVYCEIAW